MKTSRMIGLRRLSLARKLVLLTGVSTLAGAFVAGGVLFWYQAASLQIQFRDQISMLASLVASYASAPVAFADRDGGNDVLDRLRGSPAITSAELRLADGSLFARFGEEIHSSDEIDRGSGAVFEGSSLHVVRPVFVDARTVASLHVVAAFGPVRRESLVKALLPLGGIALLGLGTTVLTALGLRGSIVGPVQRLSVLAQRVADERDYSLRAEQENDDEVGKLTGAINSMLNRIESADSELRAAYARLENESRERSRLNADLVKASRLAGMAEVANGVLHNVGNVLNTVNLGVQGLRTRLEQARFRHLRQAIGLLHSEQARLGEFFRDDPRGRALPGFMDKLAGHFEEENRALIEEVTRIIEKVDHIKEIVSTQQSHARVIGVTEHTSPGDLADDAAKIVREALRRHRVTLECDFKQTPPVVADRHKVVQILVNLLNNAKDSMRESSDGERVINMGIEQAGTSHVAISVKDRGCGIDPKNLPKIFRHGFTTKANGHGFGLHMSALAAQEMHGSLRVHSDGVGCGTCFTLELPISNNPKT